MITYLKQNNSVIIKLNRPEKRNALNPQLAARLKENLITAEHDENIKCIILTGEGNTFCAGADLAYLKELNNFSAVENENDSANLAALFLQIYKFPKPTIAAVNGPAIAGGCGLASVCDFVIADPQNAKFGYTEVKIGFLPAIVSLFLIKRVGEGFAKQLLLSGQIISAQRAYETGFVNYLSENVIEKSLELANQLSENSLYSMRITKKMIQNISNFNIDEAVDYCIRLNVISRSSEDFKKGLNTFFSKK